MNKLLLVLFVALGILFVFFVPRMIEIYKPLDLKKITWNPIYDLSELDALYTAQGIEIYNDYLFFTVHKQDEESHLVVFKINNNKLSYIFTTSFPSVATHVSDLSVYKDFLYAIDYASNNLYKIDIEKTLKNKKLFIENTVHTNIPRSGSIVVTSYNNKDIIMVSQFIVDKYIKVFNLDDLPNENKKPIFEIESKFFIQGLYNDNGNIYITSNTNQADPIFITPKSTLFETKTLTNKKTLSFEGPGNMIEDIVLYNNHIITSDEERNMIYISKEKINDFSNKK